MNLSDIFLNNLIDLSQKEIPSFILKRLKICFLDYLGVSLAGSKELNDKIQKLIAIEEGTGSYPVIGFTKKTSGSISALVNGIISHHIELDDGHRIGMVHLASPIISSLIPFAWQNNLTSDKFYKGILIGYEAAIRLACAVQPSAKLKGYHATGICGIIGGAIACAVALGLSKNQMKTVLSAAATCASGLLEMIEGDTEMKPFNAGKAAMDAVASLYAGMADFKPAQDPIGGKRGFLNAMSEKPNVKYLTDFSGNYKIEEIYLKPYAACRHCHPSIEAALKFREKEIFDVAQVESIEIETYKLAVEGHNHTEIAGINSAKMSIPYSFAVALATGKAGLEEYSEHHISDDKIRSLTQKVTIRDRDDLSALCPNKRVAEVTIKTKSGEEFLDRVDFPKGEPENPMSQSEIEEKFIGLAGYKGLDDDSIQEIIKAVMDDYFDIHKILTEVCR